MAISAEIIADSINPFGDRITTFKVTFPRIILAEFNTHRLFSRNSASSRAIPFQKMADSVMNQPFVPTAFQAAHKGMQGTDYLKGSDEDAAITSWLRSRDQTTLNAKALDLIGATKQLANRLLEPYMWHTVLVTATQWDNFYKLRGPQYRIDEKTYYSRKDCMGEHELTQEWAEEDWRKVNESQAEIHIQELAERMWDAQNSHTPVPLGEHEWHLPYDPGEEYTLENRLAVATARAARISYTVPDEKKEWDVEKDISLHDRLVESGHMSPLEHSAQAMDYSDYDNYLVIEDGKSITGVCRNFKGWIQYRKLKEDNQF